MAGSFETKSDPPHDRGDVLEEGVRLEEYSATYLPGGAVEVRLRTAKGEFPAVFHHRDGNRGGAIWLSGARGGLNGPAGGLYATLGYHLISSGISSLRPHYRQPNLFPACVADALVGVDFLKRHGVERIALVGHSFGGAIAITAGALSADVAAVATLAGQTYGTGLVSELSPRPLLILHGTWDLVLDASCATNLYGRAGEPRRLVIFPGAGHSLIECQAELEDLLERWLVDTVGGTDPSTAWYDWTPRTVCLRGRPRKEIRVCLGDITEVRADGLVCPANERLAMTEGVALAVGQRGGAEIAREAALLAPGRPGEVVVTAAGQLPAKHVLHAVLPAWRQGTLEVAEQALGVAVESCFEAAEGLGVRSLACPTLGAVGPLSFERVAAIVVKTAVARLRTSSVLRRVTFVVSGGGAHQAFLAVVALSGY